MICTIGKKQQQSKENLQYWGDSVNCNLNIGQDQGVKFEQRLDGHEGVASHMFTGEESFRQRKGPE